MKKPTSKAVQLLRNSVSRQKQDWETPSHVYADACLRYAITPKLDVCATKKNTKCHEYFTMKNNGLKMEWDKPFFLNPPYNNVGEWIKKAHEMHWKYHVDGMALVFSKTGVSWFHHYLWDCHRMKWSPHVEVFMHKGRIRFLENGKPSTNVATDDSIWIVWSSKTRSQRLNDICKGGFCV